MALDIGVPGLMAYLALLGVITYLSWQVVRAERNDEKATCVGLFF